MNQTDNIKSIFMHLNQTAIVQVAMTLVIAILLVVVIRRLFEWMASKLAGRYRLYLLASIPVLRLLIIIGAVVWVIPRVIEPTFQNLVALLGAAGLALGFAFKDYIGSLVAGVVTLYEMPYRPGDWVEIDGAYGEVQSINMRALELLTPDDTVVVIPHMKLWDRMIFNANNGTRYLQCSADFYLQPAHDAGMARQMLHDVALTSPFLQVTKPVTIIVRETPWGTHYRVKAYPVDPADQFLFVSDLTVRGKAALMEHSMAFASVPAAAKIEKERTSRK